MLNNIKQSLLLVLFLLLILIGLSALPEMEVLGIRMKPVRMLSELFQKTDRRSPSITNVNNVVNDSIVMIDDAPVLFATEEGTEIVDYGDKLNLFFRKLREGESVQIAYLGDSFIEGDLMTEELRDLLQQKYGGGGVGWVECSSVTEGFRTSVKVRSEGFVPKAINEKGYRASRGLLNMHYSTLGSSKNISNIKISRYGKCGADVHEATLWFTSWDSICVMASVNGGEPERYEFEGSDDLRSITVDGDLRQVQWYVEYEDSVPDAVFYGTTLDKGTGLVLDCYSVRGFDGSGIEKMQTKRLGEFCRNYDLVILAYGMNCANDEESKEGYSRFVKIIKKDIAFLQRQYPDASILVVSVTDRAQKSEDGEVETMDCIQAMVNTQCQIAKECGVGFYNFYQSMGGYGSMKIMEEKGMANKDYTHISHGGGKLLAKKFYNAIVKNVDSLNCSIQKEAEY